MGRANSESCPHPLTRTNTLTLPDGRNLHGAFVCRRCGHEGYRPGYSGERRLSARVTVRAGEYVKAKVDGRWRRATWWYHLDADHGGPANVVFVWGESWRFVTDENVKRLRKGQPE